MFGHVEMKDAPPFVDDSEEAIEHTEGQCQYGEEVHCGNRFTMVIQERSPSLRGLRIPERFPHPAQDGSPGDLEP